MDKLKKYDRFVNEDIDGEWDEEEIDPNSQPDDNLKIVLDKDKYNKLMSFLNEHGFDFYDGIEDFDDKWNNTIGNNELSIEEKSVIITGYLDEKWGLYDGYDDVYGFLIDLRQNGGGWDEFLK